MTRSLIAWLLSCLLLWPQFVPTVPATAPPSSSLSVASIFTACSTGTYESGPKSCYSNFASNFVGTVGGGVSAGYRIVVALHSNKDCTSATNGISSVTDSASDTFTRDVTIYDSGEGMGNCIYSTHTAGISAGGSITVTYAGSSGWEGTAYSVSLDVSSGQPDCTGTSDGNTSTPGASCSGAVTQTDTVFSVVAWANTATFSSYTSGWTGMTNAVNQINTSYDYADEWKQVSSGTPNGAITVSATTNSVGVIAGYKQ